MVAIETIIPESQSAQLDIHQNQEKNDHLNNHKKIVDFKPIMLMIINRN